MHFIINIFEKQALIYLSLIFPLYSTYYSIEITNEWLNLVYKIEMMKIIIHWKIIHIICKLMNGIIVEMMKGDII